MISCSFVAGLHFKVNVSEYVMVVKVQTGQLQHYGPKVGLSQFMEGNVTEEALLQCGNRTVYSAMKEWEQRILFKGCIQKNPSQD
jgi:hypothetical protein